jgi:hypothetical protein
MPHRRAMRKARNIYLSTRSTKGTRRAFTVLTIIIAIMAAIRLAQLVYQILHDK